MIFSLQGPTMVSEPIKGKAPRVDHHNLIPAHLNEELYLWQETSQKIYGSYGEVDGIHAKIWRPCLAPWVSFKSKWMKFSFHVSFPCFLLVEVHFLNPKLFDPLLWRGSGTRRYWSISIGAWPCRVPWENWYMLMGWDVGNVWCRLIRDVNLSPKSDPGWREGNRCF